MFSFNSVQYFGVWNIFVILCQIFYTEGYVKINNVFSDGTVETQILHSVDPFILDVSNLWENQVDFVEKNTLDDTEEDDSESDRYENWIEKSWNNNREVRQIDQPLNQKRVPRQSNTGYSPLYPTLPTSGSYGYYSSYNNNVTNSNGQYPTDSNYSNFTGSTPYQYNTQYPSHNGMNSSYPKYPNNFNQGPTNGGYRPNTNYNNSGSPRYPQPASKPFYPGAANNVTNFAYQQTTDRPFYPGATNFGTNFTYPQSPYRPFSPSNSNQTFPGAVYPQTNGTSFRPGAVNSTRYPAYPAPNSTPFYPGATTNATNPSFPQTGNRPSYPGSYSNGTNHGYYPQQPNKPSYPVSTNTSTQKHTYPPSPRPVTQHNSNPPFNNAYNNSRFPTNNYPGSSPYNIQNGYPVYNTNGSSQGTIVPGPQRPIYNISNPYNSGPYGSQGYGQSYPINNTNHSPTNNLNYPQPKPNNYTNGYTQTPNSQHFGNFPQNSYPGYPNSAPNQFNPGSNQNNFFYPTPNSQPSYDPRKNPPNQFSYK